MNPAYTIILPRHPSANELLPVENTLIDYFSTALHT